MSRYYRYRLPPWMRQCLLVVEQCTLPIAIFQFARTLWIPTTFDIILSGILIGLFIGFYLKWI